MSELGLDDRTIPFGAEFDDAVVFATPVSRSDPAPVTTRITELHGDGVRLRLDAPGYLDGAARPGEDLTVLALEEGVWDIGGGRRLEVGTVMTDLTASEGFAGVTFEEPFATRPVVVAQIQTANGPDWVVPRLDTVGRDGFRVALQEDEARAETGHVVEEIGWKRRETDGRQRVQVPYDEGVANHIGPESCVVGREAGREASLPNGRIGHRRQAPSPKWGIFDERFWGEFTEQRHGTRDRPGRFYGSSVTHDCASLDCPDGSDWM